MASSFTTNLHLEEPANGDDVNTWDVPVNANMDVLDKAFGGSTLLNATGLSGDQTLSLSNYQARQLLISGLPIGTTTYVVPTGKGGTWVVENTTTGGFTIGIKSAAGGSTVVIPVSQRAIVCCDGSSTGMKFANNIPSTAGGSDTYVQFNSSGVLAGDSHLRWSTSTLTLTASNLSATTTTTGTLSVNGAANVIGTAAAVKYSLGSTTVSGLGSASPAGVIWSVTDGDAGLTWGQTVVNSGSGSIFYLVLSNGANWTVIGK